MIVDDRGESPFDKFPHAQGDVVSLEDVAAVLIDRLALTVQHVVVLEDVLPNLRVPRFHLRLRRLDGTGHHLRLDGDIFLIRRGPRHECLSCTGVEQSHEVIFE